MNSCVFYIKDALSQNALKMYSTTVYSNLALANKYCLQLNEAYGAFVQKESAINGDKLPPGISYLSRFSIGSFNLVSD